MSRHKRWQRGQQRHKRRQKKTKLVLVALFHLTHEIQLLNPQVRVRFWVRSRIRARVKVGFRIQLGDFRVRFGPNRKGYFFSAAASEL
eukprot:1185431-Amorphochlora_amoeboformis.AAC.1